MNRNEAKAYALNDLGLTKDQVRCYGNLNCTQTWLDAISAEDAISTREAVIVEDVLSAEDAIAAQASGGIAPTPSEVIAEEAVIVEDAIASIPNPETAFREPMIVAVTPAIGTLPEPATPAPSFETFWDSPSALLQPQPLLNISVLDGDWDEPEPAASQASEVIVYPLVIGLLMLWAMVQFLLLGGKALCGLLTGLAERLDFLAQERLKRRRESALQPAPALVLALSRLAQGERRQGWTVHLRRHHPQNKTTAQALGRYLAYRGTGRLGCYRGGERG